MVPTEVFVRPLLLGEVHILIDLLGPGLLSSLVPVMNRESSTEKNFFLFVSHQRIRWSSTIPTGVGGWGGHKISNRDRKDKRISPSMIYLKGQTFPVLRI
jgi:hypothetical protein